jgi:NAD-dependent dihydropyrimidine dehydrogenase PreA subunit
MQARLASENDIVDQSTNLIVLSEHPRYKDSYCSKCGICENRCPSGLKVWKIVDLIK